MNDQDAARLGKAAEHLVAASCILTSGLKLNVSTSLVDDEGVDLVFHRRGKSMTLAVQVKSRSIATKGLSQQGRFYAQVKAATFRPRRDLYLLFVPVDVDEGTFSFVWLVPSKMFAKRPVNKRGRRIFSASANDGSKDQWSKYRVERAELAGEILSAIKKLGPR
ncbi:MAG TPA: hypothetical protein VFP17_12005 [Solirubrobacterales bacterium]|nr:hypothetical protein [Solirubrobacterales bacterium]